jgi:hypothetical protein
MTTIRSGKRRLSVDISEVAYDGWEAFGLKTGGSMTAMVEMVGLWLGEQAKAKTMTPGAQALAEKIRVRSFRRRHP